MIIENYKIVRNDIFNLKKTKMKATDTSQLAMNFNFIDQ